jgi:hypothetical protein
LNAEPNVINLIYTKMWLPGPHAKKIVTKNYWHLNSFFMTNLQHFKNIASVNFVLFSLVLCFFGD